MSDTGGLTERQGARPLSAGRGNTRAGSTPAPSATLAQVLAEALHGPHADRNGGIERWPAELCGYCREAGERLAAHPAVAAWTDERDRYLHALVQAHIDATNLALNIWGAVRSVPHGVFAPDGFDEPLVDSKEQAQR